MGRPTKEREELYYAKKPLQDKWFAAQLKNIKKNNELSRKDMVLLLDIDECLLGSWITSRYSPSIERAIKIFDLLGYEMIIKKRN